MNYGLTESANIGPCIDVKAHKGRIYAIQNCGRLCVLRPESLEFVYAYEGIGNARQIEIIGDVAVITARENGVFIFDVSEKVPRLLSHYHTVEYAVGVALCGNLAFISCRQYGVEIIDVSNPENPFFVSLVRIGEVQSATVDKGVLYCGVWGEMKVVAVDISSPKNWKVISEIELWGRGDGVCVKDGVLYAATGQHERGIKSLNDESDVHFGNGNGVECFDVSNPIHPVRICGKKFGKLYSIGFDMWEAALYGDTLVVNDSELGVFGLSPDTLDEHFTVKPREGDAVTGVTCLDGDMFVATGRGDLFAVRGLGLKNQDKNRKDLVFSSEKAPFSYSGEGAELSVCYEGNFPVLAVAEGERFIALACAEGGVHMLDKTLLSLCYVIKTAGQAQDVCLHGDKLFVAEGLCGVQGYKLGESGAEEIAHLAENAAINQIKLSKSGKYILCALATSRLAVYDVEGMQKVYEYTIGKGLLYGNNFASGYLNDGTVVAFCHRDGLIFTNPDAGDKEFHRVEYTKENGFCGYCAGDGIETDGENIFYTLDGGYVMLSTCHAEPYPIENLSVFGDAASFSGLLTVDGKTIVATDRPRGLIFVLDVGDIKAPRITARLEVSASPAKALVSEGRVLIPGGRDGLLHLVH